MYIGWKYAFSTLLMSSTVLDMYSVLVYPHLEYAAPICDPYLIKDTDKFEKLQKFSIKMHLKQWNHRVQAGSV